MRRELKEGRVNEALLGIIGENVSPEGSPDLEKIKESLGKKCVSQFHRMLRQKEREAAIESFRSADTGIDPLTKETVQLSPESVEVSDYLDRIRVPARRLGTPGHAPSWSTVAFGS
jgi:hypothetical protein